MSKRADSGSGLTAEREQYLRSCYPGAPWWTALDRLRADQEALRAAGDALADAFWLYVTRVQNKGLEEFEAAEAALAAWRTVSGAATESSKP